VTRKSLLVVGAGPIGLAAAHGAVARGMEVTVLEAASEVGASLLRWGTARFFSPLSMNLPPGVMSTLPADAILSGPAFVDEVLRPLAASLGDRIKTNHRVVAIGRAGLTRADYARHPLRAERGFRILADTPNGERIFETDTVIDASGTYNQPVALGRGGLPAPGERAAHALRHLDNLDTLTGKSVLLIGHGHSAANALSTLASRAQVTWATRSLNRKPCVDVAADPLPERRRIVTLANDLAATPPSWLTIERRATVEAIEPTGDRFRVSLSGGRTATVDTLLGLTGYRPDHSILSELAIGIDPATEGAAGLARALANITDCLSLPAIAPADLESGEPGFYLAGAKSYGRARTFLLQSGYAQLQTILDRLQSRGSE